MPAQKGKKRAAKVVRLGAHRARRSELALAELDAKARAIAADPPLIARGERKGQVDKDLVKVRVQKAAGQAIARGKSLASRRRKRNGAKRYPRDLYFEGLIARHFLVGPRGDVASVIPIRPGAGVEA